MQYQLKLSINFQIFMDMKYFDEVFLYYYKFLTVIYIFLRRFENSLIMLVPFLKILLFTCAIENLLS